jgi:hypothetical protein
VKSYHQGIATLLALKAWVWAEFTDRSNPANRRRDAKAADRSGPSDGTNQDAQPPRLTCARAKNGDCAFAGRCATGTHPRGASTRRSVDVSPALDCPLLFAEGWHP